MKKFKELRHEQDIEPYIPQVIHLIYEAGLPFYDYLLGNSENAYSCLEQMVRKESSEVFIRNVTVLVEDNEVVGGLLALDSSKLKECRISDSEILFNFFKYESEDQLLNKLTVAQELFKHLPISEYYLSKITVAQNHRRKGYGRELFQRYLDKGKELGYSRFSLEVSGTNTSAKNLYKSFGFQIQSRSKSSVANMEYCYMLLDKKLQKRRETREHSVQYNQTKLQDRMCDLYFE